LFKDATELEITRIARKELRAETESLKKASAHYRSEIAALKRRIGELERQVARAEKGAVRAAAAEPAAGEIKIRYSARSMAAQRKRLGLSAENMGKLIGVSGQTIYGWEAGNSRPRNGQMTAIAAVRKLGRREAVAIVEGRSGAAVN
jgi:DNA-binding XRE family transcriptional regulator